MGLWDFLSPEAGQKRRKWLDKTVGEQVQYYLGGTGIGDRVAAVGSVMNPITNVDQAGTAAKAMVRPGATGWERVGAAGEMLSNVAGVVAPAVGAKMVGGKAADAITESLTNMSAGPKMAANEFMADEFGGMRLYHGSPHDFDKFSMDKIGTGVGAPDAYSRGLYFAESPAVAEHFKRLGASPMIGSAKGRSAGLSDDAYELVYKFTNDGGKGTLADVAARAEADLASRQGQLPASAVREYRKIIDELAGRGGEDVRLGANMYEVDVNATPDTFADWDKPISEQSDKVKAALSAFPPEKTWREVYESGRLRPEDARSKGLAGTTYKAGDGSRNYVVFDENLISIVKKYGIAGAATILGMTALDVEKAMAGQSE